MCLLIWKIYSERSPANWSIYIPKTQQPFSLRSLKLDIRPKGAEGPLVTSGGSALTRCEVGPSGSVTIQERKVFQFIGRKIL